MYDLDDDFDDLEDFDNFDDLDYDLDESSRVDCSPRWVRAVRALPVPPGRSRDAI